MKFIDRNAKDDDLIRLGAWLLWGHAPATFQRLVCHEPQTSLFRKTLATRVQVPLGPDLAEQLASLGRKSLCDLPRDAWLLDLRGWPTLPTRSHGPFMWGLGNPATLRTQGVALVGSRQCDANRIEWTAKFTDTLIHSGLTLISGGARGVDTVAHQRALALGGKTIAVLATGIDRLYPRANLGLFTRIQEKGCIVTTFAPGTSALRYHFPKRNKTIASLAKTVLVMSASIKSGTLSTARAGMRLGRPVLVLPGEIDDRLAQGCNVLLAEGALPLGNPAWLSAWLQQEKVSHGIQESLLPTPPVPLNSRPKEPDASSIFRPSHHRAPVVGYAPPSHQVIRRCIDGASPSHGTSGHCRAGGSLLSPCRLKAVSTNQSSKVGNNHGMSRKPNHGRLFSGRLGEDDSRSGRSATHHFLQDQRQNETDFKKTEFDSRDLLG